MDLNLTPGEREFRDEFRAWLAANVPEEWAGGGTGSEDRAEYIEYLRAWQHLQDVSFAGGDAWAPLHSLGNAPKSRKSWNINPTETDAFA